MSYDLMVFETSEVIKSRGDFMVWYAEPTQWGEDHNYQDHTVTTEALQNWFKEMALFFLPMNGPLASDDADDPKVTDYSIGKMSFIFLLLGQ